MRVETHGGRRSEVGIDPINNSRVRAERWLLNSGICILDRSNPNYGAVHSYFDCDEGDFELIYSEATGYLISLLRYLHSVREDPELVRLAVASGEWLLTVGEEHDGIIEMGQRDGRHIRRAYAFDNGICCKALLDLYELTGDNRFLERAERIAEWLTDVALNNDGSMRPVLDLESGAFTVGSAWYEVSGSFHSKVGMALLQLYSINGDERVRDGALRIYAWALGQQDAGGSFPVNRRSRSVNLHFHCYTVEALLYAYASTSQKAFLDAAIRAIHWLVGVQKSHGGFQLWRSTGRWSSSRPSYVAAQASRLFLMMCLLEGTDRFLDAARRAVGSLTEMQVSSPDTRIDGGFLEEQVAWHALSGGHGRRVTSWATMFAVHALALLEGSREEHLGQAITGMF